MVLAIIGLIVLVLLSRNPASATKVKARPQRITTVNSVRSVSLTITNTSPAPGGQPGAGE